MKTSDSSLRYESGTEHRVSKKTALLVLASVLTVVGVMIALIR